jgi:hypothetical protein
VRRSYGSMWGDYYVQINMISCAHINNMAKEMMFSWMHTELCTAIINRAVKLVALSLYMHMYAQPGTACYVLAPVERCGTATSLCTGPVYRTTDLRVVGGAGLSQSKWRRDLCWHLCLFQMTDSGHSNASHSPPAGRTCLWSLVSGVWSVVCRCPRLRAVSRHHRLA